MLFFFFFFFFFFYFINSKYDKYFNNKRLQKDKIYNNEHMNYKKLKGIIKVYK